MRKPARAAATQDQSILSHNNTRTLQTGDRKKDRARPPPYSRHHPAIDGRADRKRCSVTGNWPNQKLACGESQCVREALGETRPLIARPTAVSPPDSCSSSTGCCIKHEPRQLPPRAGKTNDPIPMQKRCFERQHQKEGDECRTPYERTKRDHPHDEPGPYVSNTAKQNAGNQHERKTRKVFQ